MKIKTDTNKRIQTNIIIICIIVFILISFAVYAFLYDFYKGGIVGTATKISDIPCANSDFDGFNAKGPFKYVYKIDHRTTKYMFTGITSKEEFLHFCSSEKGWGYSMIMKEYETFNPPYDYLNVSPLDFPTGDPNDFFASNHIQVEKENGGWSLMFVFFRQKDGRFTAYTCRSHRREDWDNW